MENPAFPHEDSKQVDAMESQMSTASAKSNSHGGNDLYAFKAVAVQRAASVTKEEEQVTFSWDSLTVKTRATKGRSLVRKNQPKASKTIVHDAKGFVKPGELVAIMGASGAGKSTLLNALTFRNLNKLDVKGDRFINGIKVTPNSLTAVSAYIQQDDLFIGTLTPREHLEFMARVRMDQSLSQKKRQERVEAVILELGLAKCQDTLIGISGRVKGISGGESKRLAFASEVLTNPPLLFCDEPTSGLDSYMAQNVVGVLRGLTSHGKAIICTIHQPSSQVFAIFDKVLLMAEGKLAYFGGVTDALRFFSNVGYPCPDKFNPADHYVHVLAITPGDEDTCRKRVGEICQQFEQSDWGQEMEQEVSYQMTHRQDVPLLKKESRRKSPYRASWLQQFRALLWRAWLSVIKDPQIVRVNVGQTIIISIMLGIVFLQQGPPYSQLGAQNIAGAIFIILTNITFANQFAVINVFCLELPIFMREHFNGTYRVDTYFITKQMAELPIFLTLPIVFTSIVYWMVGFNEAPERFAIACAIVVLITQVVISFGYFISCIASNVNMALALAPPILVPLLLFGGFFINGTTIPSWLAWIQYISWFKYGNEVLSINQWKDMDDIICPSGTEVYNTTLTGDLSLTCPDVPVPTLDCEPGESVTLPVTDFPISVQVPQPCLLKTGEDVLEQFGFDEDNFYFDIGMLFVLMVVLRLGGLIALHIRTYRKKS